VKHVFEDWQEGGFGLYLHWPFCQSKCPYCDFNSHVARDIDHARWRSAYIAEVDRVGALTEGRILQTVFFGGGTPSLMEPSTVHAVLERIKGIWRTANAIEITLEANPGSVEAGRFADYREAGVNRISMGVQSLRDAPLRQLGRLHNVAEARKAFDTARQLFDRVSFDLIYARQDQQLEEWRSELTEALAMAVDHLSLYQLTVEPGTAFGDRFAGGGLSGLPAEPLAADMYELTQDLCESAGMPAYEVSNHAREGAESRHNRIYWTGGDYAGIGPGAHGRLTLHGFRTATEALHKPLSWLEAVEAGFGAEESSTLDPHEQALEYMLMGLRISEGISLPRLTRMAGSPLSEAVITSLEESGHLLREGERLRTTLSGRMLLNTVIRRLYGGLGTSD
jgi:putative oxygen-independent coproporphyrinogen III oxidase